MAFFLFIVLNGILFIRPAEIIPPLKGVELYMYTLIPTLAFALPELLSNFFDRPIESQPLTLCLFGIFGIVLIPQLLNGDTAELWRTGFHYFKMLVYYLLLISVVTTPQRLRVLFGSWAVFCAVMTVVTVLNHFDYITIEGLEKMVTQEPDEQGFVVSFRRLIASGLFRDPNDLCVLLATVTVPTLYLLVCDRNIFLKPLWLICLILFAYGIELTKSRGGFLALSGAVAAALYFRIGWQRFLLISVIAAPFVVSGLGIMLLDRRGTSNTRIQLWSDWMTRFRENPVFGEGMNLTDDSKANVAYNPEDDFHLAHNSYIQAFADTGIFGGSLFLGAFLLANWSLARYSFHGSEITNPELAAMLPYVVGTVTAYSIGMFTLTLCYYIPTVAILGISASFVRMAPTRPRLEPVQFEPALLGGFVFCSLAFLGAMYIFLRIFLRWA